MPESDADELQKLVGRIRTTIDNNTRKEDDDHEEESTRT